ncbi:tRNA-dihydrouridine synthase family protein [Candidatus Woesearchaeota archaeon]|nr:MAG: tRNA-dihydrouridine synthase family protein [Candidatus Woesearchaeota archaeon]
MQFMAAPLEDNSDSAFRSICHTYGADLTFTEMTHVIGLAKGNMGTLSKIEMLDDTPTVIQLAANKEMSLKKFLSKYQPPKQFKGINFNMGCPAPKVLNIGLGCALMKRIALTKKLVAIVKDYGYPCSLKIRLGMNKFEKEKKVYLNLIDAVDADYFIVHARYGTQTYAEPADFSIYPECVALGKTIIANGDIHTSEQVALLRDMGVQGVMIGRAAVHDPSIFNKLKGLPVPSVEKIKEEYVALAEKFNSRFKYRDNILKRIGTHAKLSGHVMG